MFFCIGREDLQGPDHPPLLRMEVMLVKEGTQQRDFKMCHSGHTTNGWSDCDTHIHTHTHVCVCVSRTLGRSQSPQNEAVLVNLAAASGCASSGSLECPCTLGRRCRGQTPGWLRERNAARRRMCACATTMRKIIPIWIQVCLRLLASSQGDGCRCCLRSCKPRGALKLLLAVCRELCSACDLHANLSEKHACLRKTPLVAGEFFSTFYQCRVVFSRTR